MYHKAKIETQCLNLELIGTRVFEIMEVNMNITKRSVIARNGIIITLFVLLMMAVFTRSTFAATTTAKASKPRIESVKYEGNGKFDIDFYGKVSLRNARVVVKDMSGKTYKAVITERDDDDMDVVIKNYKAGAKYRITIKNVKRWGSNKKYTVTTKKLSIPKAPKASGAPVVKEVEFDWEDQEVSIEFRGKVNWKNAKVVITGADGKNLVTRIIEKDDDDIEVKVRGMVNGGRYTYSISGVKKAGASGFTTVSGSFVAFDD